MVKLTHKKFSNKTKKNNRKSKRSLKYIKQQKGGAGQAVKYIEKKYTKLDDQLNSLNWGPPILEQLFTKDDRKLHRNQRVVTLFKDRIAYYETNGKYVDCIEIKNIENVKTNYTEKELKLMIATKKKDYVLFEPNNYDEDIYEFNKIIMLWEMEIKRLMFQAQKTTAPAAPASAAPASSAPSAPALQQQLKTAPAPPPNAAQQQLKAAQQQLKAAPAPPVKAAAAPAPVNVEIVKVGSVYKLLNDTDTIKRGTVYVTHIDESGNWAYCIEVTSEDGGWTQNDKVKDWVPIEDLRIYKEPLQLKLEEEQRPPQKAALPASQTAPAPKKAAPAPPVKAAPAPPVKAAAAAAAPAPAPVKVGSVYELVNDTNTMNHGTVYVTHIDKSGNWAYCIEVNNIEGRLVQNEQVKDWVPIKELAIFQELPQKAAPAAPLKPAPLKPAPRPPQKAEPNQGPAPEQQKEIYIAKKTIIPIHPETLPLVNGEKYVITQRHNSESGYGYNLNDKTKE